MTETKVKDSPSPQKAEEKDSLRNNTAVFKTYLEDLQLLFHGIERSPDRPERELLQTSPTWSMISSPLEVIFQTDESSCSNSSQLPVESSIFDEDEAEMIILSRSQRRSMISSPLEVIFRTHESSCSNSISSQLPVESSIFDEDEDETEDDDNSEEGYEADISNPEDEEDETDDP